MNLVGPYAVVISQVSIFLGDAFCWCAGMLVLSCLILVAFELHSATLEFSTSHGVLDHQSSTWTMLVHEVLVLSSWFVSFCFFQDDLLLDLVQKLVRLC